MASANPKGVARNVTESIDLWNRFHFSTKPVSCVNDYLFYLWRRGRPTCEWAPALGVREGWRSGKRTRCSLGWLVLLCVHTVESGIFVMLKVSSGTFSITIYLLLRWEYAQMTSDEHFSPGEVIALSSHHFNLSQRTSDSRGSIKKSGSTRRLFSKTVPTQEGNLR